MPRSRRASARPRTVLGLNSGTSINSLDWAVVRFSGLRPDVKLVDAGEIRFPAALQKALRKCAASDRVLKAGLSCLDAEFGTWLGRQVVKIRHRHARSTPIDFVASHGQTVGHWPAGRYGASLQIGDPDRIAKMSGLPVISHFRQGDMAVGGEGAPLTPAVNRILFARPDRQIAILNLGGMANLTIVLPATSRVPVKGTDCGPGNMLLDLAAVRFLRRAYDPGGRLAVTGEVSHPLLATAQRHPWFHRKLPASCGREEFGHAFFRAVVAKHSRVSGRDVAATLAHLTAWSVARALGRLGGRPKIFYVCGGGVHNRRVVSELEAVLAPVPVRSTADLGFAPDTLEAVSFALLGWLFASGRPLDLRLATGARRPAILGRLSLP